MASACAVDDITGHLSLTFGIPEDLAFTASTKCEVTEKEIDGLLAKIWVADSKPTPSLGVLAFADVSEDLASGRC